MFYLSRFVGSGTTLDDAIRPSVDGVKRIIDLRGDPTDPAGRCLLWTPDRQPASPTRVTLGDDLDEPMPRPVSRILENTLGVTLDADRLRSAIVELLLLHGTADHDQSRWNRLTARRGRHRIWLGELVFDAPAILGASFTETWTTADSDTIDADQDWTEVSGNHFEIISGKLRSKDPGAVDADGYARAEVDLDSDDHYAQGDCTWLEDLSGWVGPAVRFSPSASTFYLAVANAQVDEEHIFKSTAGTFADLGSNARTLAASTFLIRLEADGSDLHAEFDSGQAGETVLDITDTSITGNVRVGLFAIAHHTASLQTEVDNFEAADLATAATVTPAAIARSFTIPAATVAGVATTTPAAISRSVTIPAPTVQGAAATTPATVVTTVTTPAASVSGGAIAEPAVTAQSVTIPQASPGTPGTTTPDAIARNISVNAATPSGSAVTELAAIAQSFILPQTSPAGPGAVAPDTTITTAAVPQATPQGFAATSPAAIESSFTLPAVTVEGVGTVEPATITLAFTLPAVTPIGGGEPETVTPDTVSLAYTTPAPTISGGAVAEPSTLTVVADVEAALARVGAVVAPDAVARSFNLPAATAKVTATVLASVIELAVVIGRAVKKIIHSPNPATAPLAVSGTGTAPSSTATLAAVLVHTGMSTAEPNTGKSAAPGGSSGTEAE